MSTKSIVPRANNEGKIGTSAKKWSEGHFTSLYQAGVQVSTLTNAVRNLSTITALTGGTATKLDSIAIDSTMEGQRLAMRHSSSGADLEYLIVAGTDSENAPWVVRPDNFNASTNAFVCKLTDVKKAGAPCFWDAVASKFHQQVAFSSGGVVTIEIDQTGFQITS